MSYAGVRGMRICQKGKAILLLTGGADGIIKRYDVSSGDIQVCSDRTARNGILYARQLVDLGLHKAVTLLCMTICQ